jgi:hypothetical protein
VIVSVFQHLEYIFTTEAMQFRQAVLDDVLPEMDRDHDNHKASEISGSSLEILVSCLSLGWSCGSYCCYCCCCRPAAACWPCWSSCWWPLYRLYCCPTPAWEGGQQGSLKYTRFNYLKKIIVKEISVLLDSEFASL